MFFLTNSSEFKKFNLNWNTLPRKLHYMAFQKPIKYGRKGDCWISFIWCIKILLIQFIHVKWKDLTVVVLQVFWSLSSAWFSPQGSKVNFTPGRQWIEKMPLSWDNCNPHFPENSMYEFQTLLKFITILIYLTAVKKVLQKQFWN